MRYVFDGEVKERKVCAPKPAEVVRLDKDAREVIHAVMCTCVKNGIEVTYGRLVSDMVRYASGQIRFEEGI